LIGPIVYSVTFGLILAVGWFLMDNEIDTFLEALGFFIFGTGLFLVVTLLTPIIRKRIRR